MKHVLFVAETIPADDIGSAAIFHRHFRALADHGWSLHMISHSAAPVGEACYWDHVRLPTRQPWWPPLRRRWRSTVRLRVALQRGWLRRHLQQLPPTGIAVLTQLWDDLSLLATAVARSRCWPLGVFHHDDEIGWETDSSLQPYLHWKRSLVSAAADRIWPVSDDLAAQLSPAARAKCHVLRPVPGALTGPGPTWNDVQPCGLRLGYAGKTYGAFQPFLQKLAGCLAAHGGVLELITDADNARLLDGSQPNVRARPFFAHSRDAAEWLRAHCSAVLVAHPLDFSTVAPRWKILRTSFPSKLTEAAQIGLPLVLITSPDTAFGKWAGARTGAPFFQNPEAPALGSYLDQLQTAAGWETAARWTHELGAGEFSPSRIQAEWEADLNALLLPGRNSPAPP